MLLTKNLLLALIISLLVIHEMDAVRAKEWKMFIFLKDMADEMGYRVFTILHLPLFLVAFYVMTLPMSAAYGILSCIIDIFVILHAFAHVLFRRHEFNEFKSLFSRIIINSMAVLGVLHLVLLVT